MSFGVLFKGDNGQVIIDDTHPVLTWVYQGTYKSDKDWGQTGWARVTFPAPISSPFVPWLFVRPFSGHLIRYVRILGGPGAWTGFEFQMGPYYDTVWDLPWGDWMVAAYCLPPVGTWGLRIFDAAARIVFDSARIPTSFSFGTQTWFKSGYNANNGVGQTVDTWKINIGPPPDTTVAMRFVFINPWLFKPGGSVDYGFLMQSGENSSEVNSVMYRAGAGQPQSNKLFNWPLIAAVFSSNLTIPTTFR